MVPENLSFYLFGFVSQNESVNVFFAGLLFNLSLILALGPQNALILKYGLRRQAITLVIAVCALCDITLITLSGIGVGVILEKAPIVLEILRYGGFLYLLWFAFTCFRDAIHPKAIETETVSTSEPHTVEVAAEGGSTATLTKTRRRTFQDMKGPAIAAFVVSVVNPAAWVDLFVVIGSISSSYGPDKWSFLLGTMAAAFVWFPAFGYGAAALSKPLSSPKVWRYINTGIGLFMVFMAFRVLFM